MGDKEINDISVGSGFSVGLRTQALALTWGPGVGDTSDQLEYGGGNLRTRLYSLRRKCRKRRRGIRTEP